jgi:uncharacterized membrane protein
MVECKVDIVVNAPQARVFDVFSDLTQAQARVSSIKQLELLTDGPIATGTRWRETRVMFGKEAKEEMEIAGFFAPNFYEAVAQSHGSTYRSRFDFAPDGHATRVTMTFTSSPESLGAKVMTAVLGGYMMKSVGKLMRRDMEDLKAVAEIGA